MIVSRYTRTRKPDNLSERDRDLRRALRRARRQVKTLSRSSDEFVKAAAELYRLEMINEKRGLSL